MGERRFVFLAGNLSEGFTAYGPYDSLGEACGQHEGWDGWVMDLKEPIPT